MIDAFYTAKSGTMAYQQSLNIVSNNLANANTTGFKATRAEFTDLIYQNLQEGTNAVQGGSGTKIQATPMDLTQGLIEQTGRLLDFSITGNGFFAVGSKAVDNIDPEAVENITYTRAGDFTISTEEDGKSYLVTKDGEYVLNDKYEKIVLEGSLRDILFSSPVKAQDDNIIAPVLTPEQTAENKPEPVIIGVFDFNNPYALTALGNSRFSGNANTGEAFSLIGADINQFSLERSNTDLVSEMQRMIYAQRGFQLSARIIQTADEAEQIANTLSS